MYTTRVLGACSKGNVGLLKELSREGDIKSCCDKFGAIGVHYAVRAGNLECLMWLVGECGLNPDKPANNGATPMHDAAATGQLECLKWLINSGGCYPNTRDGCKATPLHLAARFGHLSIVSWLVESEFCNPLDKAQNGVTSVHLAAAKGSLNCLKWLIERDRTAVDVRSDSGATPAYFAAQEGRLDCLQFLIAEMKGNPKLRTVEGMAPVHVTAQMGHVHCLAWLVECTDVLITDRDKDGATPLHFAAARGHVKAVRWLLEHRSTQEVDDFGSTPLHDAAEHGQLESIKILLEHGADVNMKDMDGMTPSVLGRECGHFDCSAVLLAEHQHLLEEQHPPQPVATLENPPGPRILTSSPIVPHIATLGRRGSGGTSTGMLSTSSPPVPHAVMLGRRGSDSIPALIPNRRRHYSWKSSSSSESGSSGDGSLRYRTLQYGQHDNLLHTERKVMSAGKYGHFHHRPQPELSSASTHSTPHHVNGDGTPEWMLPQWKRDLLLQRRLQKMDLNHEEKSSVQKLRPATPTMSGGGGGRDGLKEKPTREELSAKFQSLPEWKKNLLRQSMPNYRLYNN
jgi:ankyrin repeat protein